MVRDLSRFALFLAHDQESVKKKYLSLFCGIKIANTASLVIDRASVLLTHSLPSRKSTKLMEWTMSRVRQSNSGCSRIVGRARR